MSATQGRSTSTDWLSTAPPRNDRHDVALEPGQAWCLKGTMGEPDEIIIPGLLLDDLGGCSNVEASLDTAAFYQMLAMAALQEGLMMTARAAPEPSRERPEANVWAVEGRLEMRRLTVSAIRSLDRVVVDAAGTRCMETMHASALIPGPRAWR